MPILHFRDRISAMSFWENNKDSFKSAGKATAVGIGRGTKLVAKTGYSTYKKNEAKRKGQPEPGSNESSAAVGKPINTVDLGSLPLPPKRNVPTYETTLGEPSKYAQMLQQSYQQQPYQQSPAQPGAQLQSDQQPQTNPQLNQQPQINRQPSEQPQLQPQASNDPAPPYTSTQQAPPPPPRQPSQNSANLVQDVQGVPPRLNQLPGFANAASQSLAPPQLPAAPRPQVQAPPAQPAGFSPNAQAETLNPPPPNTQNNQIDVAASAYPSPSYQKPFSPNNTNGLAPSVGEAQPEQKPKKPLPDPTSFAPPPIRRDRPAAAPTVKQQPSNSSQSQPSPAVNNATPPPPPARQTQPPADSFQPPPPPYYRSSPLSSGRSTPVVPNPEAEQNTAGQQAPVKPPKPTKKPAHLSRQPTVEATVAPANDFISELAARQLRLQGNLTGSSAEIKPKPELKPKPGTKPKPEIKAKPEIKLKPEVKSKPEIKAKPEVNSKPEIKSTPDIKPKPVIMPKPGVTQAQDEELSERKVFGTHQHGSQMSELESRFKKIAVPAAEAERPVVPPLVKPKPSIPKKNVSTETPPPAPPSRNSAKSSPSPAPRTDSAPPPPPPPARNYSRAKVEAPKPEESGPPNFDLEIGTGWYMNTSSPLELPKALQGLNYSTSVSVSFFGGTSNLKRTVDLRLADLGILLYEILWQNDKASSATVQVAQYVPSPLKNPVTSDELIKSNQQFGEYVASWTEHNMGNKVATGECWDVAQKALQKGCGNHAFVSTYYHHGYPILTATGSPSGPSIVPSAPLDEIRRGDILQFKSCVFSSSAGTQTVGAPDHTSVVLQVSPSVIYVGEQNVNGKRFVVKGQYELANLKQGTVVVYRPMPKAWAGDF